MWHRVRDRQNYRVANVLLRFRDVRTNRPENFCRGPSRFVTEIPLANQFVVGRIVVDRIVVGRIVESTDHSGRGSG